MNKSTRNSTNNPASVTSRAKAFQAKHELVEQLNGKVESIYPNAPRDHQRHHWCEAARAVSKWLTGQHGSGLLIMGAVGRGKTELLKAASWFIAANGRRVNWVRPAVQVMRPNWQLAEELEETLSYDAIMVNDVSTPDEGRYVRTIVLNAIDAGKFVGIATNLSEKNLYGLLGGDIRVNSRQDCWARIVMTKDLPDLRRNDDSSNA